MYVGHKVLEEVAILGEERDGVEDLARVGRALLERVTREETVDEVVAHAATLVHVAQGVAARLGSARGDEKSVRGD